MNSRREKWRILICCGNGYWEFWPAFYSSENKPKLQGWILSHSKRFQIPPILSTILKFGFSQLERISLKKGRTHSSLDPNLQHTSKICPSVINLNPGQTSFHRFRSRFPPIPLRSFEFGIPSLPSINVPSSYRFFNRAAYCRRCIPSDRGIVRVSRERSRLIRHRKTRSFPIFGFYFVPQPAGDGRNPLNSSILSR